MGRLTEKLDAHYRADEVFYEQGKPQFVYGGKVIDKLGQLEDIEEELGIELSVLFKAIKNGVWVWNDKKHTEYFKDKVYGFTNYKTKDGLTEYKTKTFRLIGVDYYEMKDYGKTWALTKEELENETNNK